MQDFWQGLLVGSLVGSGVGGHALRLVALGTAQPSSRHYVAVAGIVLYTVAAVLTATGALSGPVISILGPVVGLTAVLLSKSKVDTFQIVLGVFQVLSAAVGVYLLVRHFLE